MPENRKKKSASGPEKKPDVAASGGETPPSAAVIDGEAQVISDSAKPGASSPQGASSPPQKNRGNTHRDTALYIIGACAAIALIVAGLAGAVAWQTMQNLAAVESRLAAQTPPDTLTRSEADARDAALGEGIENLAAGMAEMGATLATLDTRMDAMERNISAIAESNTGDDNAPGGEEKSAPESASADTPESPAAPQESPSPGRWSLESLFGGALKITRTPPGPETE